MEDLYQLLNCSMTASLEDLKKSYQDLALKYHPDKCTNDTASSSEAFIKVDKAWKILGDKYLREQYNIRWQERSLAQTYPVQDTVDFEEFEIIESEIFNDESNTGIVSENNKIQSDCRNNCISKSSDDIDEQKRSMNSENVLEGEECKNAGNDSAENENSKGVNSSELDYESVHSYPCRCGGGYVLTEADVQMKFDYVCCDSCSLTVQVIYSGNDEME